ncbi:uncharacterized protein SCHCODRAFT_02617218 [Schizophyllum commune H4-8]|nr:uncharacterized protein SCHCODRAFT_02617218 [Schizophyllum commune H4-8]KAI5894533.1 hypothetical protein SCHCODRAFT_02617218 [Schizophyllum commune H4-8]
MHADALLEKAVRMASLELQRSGYVPSSGEARVVNDITAALQEEVPSIDAEIRRLFQLRAQLLRQCDIQDSFVAPIRRLPPELLSAIFIEVVGDRVYASDRVFVVRHILSCVCTSWRSVARSTPALWTRIPTQLWAYKMKPKSCDYKHAIESAVLAGGLPLEVHHEEAAPDGLLIDVLKALQPHFARVRCISVQGSFSLFECLRKISMPAVRKLSMGMLGRPTTGVLDYLTGFPALRALDIHYTSKNRPYTSLESLRIPPLPGLTYLDVSISAMLSRQALLGALSSCAPTLVHLSLSNRSNASASAQATLVRMDALRRMALTGASYEILDNLATPALHHLGLHAVTADEGDGDPFPTVSAFLSRPSKPRGLTELVTSVCIGHTSTFLRCLEQLEELTSLDIHGVFYEGLAHESVFSRLACREGESPLLPRLTMFQTALPPLDVRSPEAETTLKEMVASRSTPRVCAFPGLAALVKVEIDLDGIQDDESDASESEDERAEESD